MVGLFLLGYPVSFVYLLAVIPLVYYDFVEDRKRKGCGNPGTRAAMICTIVISEASRLPQVL